MGISYGLAMLLVFLALLLFSALRILREYERGVVFQLGRFWKVKGPGLVLVIPAIQQMVRIDLRTIVLDVPPQDVISRDNVSVKVNAVVYFRVLDPQKAIIQVENYLAATSQLAQTTLRAVLGKHELDEMLAERERLNLDIQQVLDAQTDAWGIKVANVEIKHVDLNESMVRAIARQAEAERERRAKVIHAEGELQASEKLMQAAQMLGRQSGAMQLREIRCAFSASASSWHCWRVWQKATQDCGRKCWSRRTTASMRCFGSISKKRCSIWLSACSDSTFTCRGSRMKVFASFSMPSG